ncbi:MAG TPA: 2-succinyl-5-enolpyruvyl-6-hydroxy-3-cyclohexene-1-carboxylic-acid synthase [Opitutaceae bacterium]
MNLDYRNTNALWSSVLVETLARCGVRHAVASPGSRSTPLTMALVRHPAIETIPVLDERSAAFFALGLAKQTHRPVVLVCTSGTAGAHYFPAIIEAHESGVPLLVLTADRPPEMRECASGQTIDQQKLFGGFVGFYHELAVPESRLELLRYLRQTIAHAVSRTRASIAGPVHVNAPFRDPLPPIEDASCAALRDGGGIDETFFAHLAPSEAAAVTAVFRQKATTARGLIVAGPASPGDVLHYVTRIRAVAESLGWPVLADALSPLRHYGVDVATTYDAILRNEASARELAPRFVLCLDAWPTSKVLRQWLERSGAEVVLVSAGAVNRDALHGRTRQLPADPTQLVLEGAAMPDASYRDAWLAAERRVRDRLDAALAGTDALFEAKAAWLLGRQLPEGTAVVTANSMPVRDLEYVWPASARRYQIHFSRGANGIDGTLSTALGIAHGGAPTVLLTGDLALLHDTNGFLVSAKLRGSLTIVLINNAGGGIFEHLPVAQFEPPFEEFFATPQRVDFGKLCAAYGVEHTLVRDWAQFTKLVSVLPPQGVRVLEVCTDRKKDAAMRKRLFAEVAR